MLFKQRKEQQQQQIKYENHRFASLSGCASGVYCIHSRDMYSRGLICWLFVENGRPETKRNIIAIGTKWKTTITTSSILSCSINIQHSMGTEMHTVFDLNTPRRECVCVCVCNRTKMIFFFSLLLRFLVHSVHLLAYRRVVYKKATIQKCNSKRWKKKPTSKRMSATAESREWWRTQKNMAKRKLIRFA